jgi:hypothetical protein
MYPENGTGLMACYAAALPFFQATLTGDVLYSGVLFGIFALVQSRILTKNNVIA